MSKMSDMTMTIEELRNAAAAINDAAVAAAVTKVDFDPYEQKLLCKARFE